MKSFALIYLLGFISAWGPVIFFMIINHPALAVFTPQKRIDLINWAAGTTVIGVVMMAVGASGLIVNAVLG